MKEHLTFIDIFAGIGGFHSGMEKAGHKCVGWVEWDKFARQSYKAMYDTEGLFTANDIQQIWGGDLPDSDVWCFGSPCQNISLAGNQQGLKGSKSSMFFEVIRLLAERAENYQTKPAYLLMENVKNLLSSNGGWDFARVQIEMDKAGYDVEWNVFNSADVVPQNRERTYIVGHLRGQRTRKVFPIIRQGKTTNQKPGIKVIGNVSRTNHHSDDVVDEGGIAKTITAQNAYKHTPKVAVHQVGQLHKNGSFGGNPQVGRVYGADGLSPTLNTMQGGGREPKILVRNANKLGYAVATLGDGIDLHYPNSKTRRGRVQHKRSNTLTTDDGLGVIVGNETLRIRKLTPLECWRLQGFTDEQFYKAKETGVSNSQLYKQAGNAVTVPVVEAIAERLQVNN